MKGRKPTPSAILRMRGSWMAKEPRHAVDLLLPRGELVPPEWLTKEARVVWDRVLPPLMECGIPVPSDTEQLANYCELQAKLIAALDDVNRHGQWQPVLDKDGNVVGNEIRGSMQIVLRISPIIQRIADAFGMNPSARPRVKLSPKPTTAEAVDKRKFFESQSGAG